MLSNDDDDWSDRNDADHNHQQQHMKETRGGRRAEGCSYGNGHHPSLPSSSVVELKSLLAAYLEKYRPNRFDDDDVGGSCGGGMGGRRYPSMNYAMTLPTAWKAIAILDMIVAVAEGEVDYEEGPITMERRPNIGNEGKQQSSLTATIEEEGDGQLRCRHDDEVINRSMVVDFLTTIFDPLGEEEQNYCWMNDDGDNDKCNGAADEYTATAAAATTTLLSLLMMLCPDARLTEMTNATADVAAMTAAEDTAVEFIRAEHRLWRCMAAYAAATTATARNGSDLLKKAERAEIATGGCATSFTTIRKDAESDTERGAAVSSSNRAPPATTSSAGDGRGGGLLVVESSHNDDFLILTGGDFDETRRNCDDECFADDNKNGMTKNKPMSRSNQQQQQQMEQQRPPTSSFTLPSSSPSTSIIATVYSFYRRRTIRIEPIKDEKEEESYCGCRHSDAQHNSHNAHLVGCVSPAILLVKGVSPRVTLCHTPSREIHAGSASPLMVASMKGCCGVIKALIGGDGDYGGEEGEGDVRRNSDSGAIHSSASFFNKHKKEIAIIIPPHVSINSFNSTRRTPLMAAITRNQVSAATLLIRSPHCNLTLANGSGMNILRIVMEAPNLYVSVPTWHDHPKAIFGGDTPSKTTPREILVNVILEEVEKNLSLKAESVAQKGPDGAGNTVSGDGDSSSSFSSRYDHRILDLTTAAADSFGMVLRGKSAPQRSSTSTNTTTTATAHHHDPVDASLLAHGAPVDTRGNFLRTPLLRVIAEQYQGDLGMLQLYADNGCDVAGVVDANGDGPLELVVVRSRRYGGRDVVVADWLIDHGGCDADGFWFGRRFGGVNTISAIDPYSYPTTTTTSPIPISPATDTQTQRPPHPLFLNYVSSIPLGRATTTQHVAAHSLFVSTFGVGPRHKCLGDGSDGCPFAADDAQIINTPFINSLLVGSTRMANYFLQRSIRQRNKTIGGGNSDDKSSACSENAATVEEAEVNINAQAHYSSHFIKTYLITDEERLRREKAFASETGDNCDERRRGLQPLERHTEMAAKPEEAHEKVLPEPYGYHHPLRGLLVRGHHALTIAKVLGMDDVAKLIEDHPDFAPDSAFR